MKRLHIHVTVSDLDKAVGFYGKLFAAAPTVLKPDYAKWRLEDPVINFAISSRGEESGINHLGIEVDDGETLDEIEARLAAAGAEVIEQRSASCCYAKSDKAWTSDPDGVFWETFLSQGQSDTFGEDSLAAAMAAGGKVSG